MDCMDCFIVTKDYSSLDMQKGEVFLCIGRTDYGPDEPTEYRFESAHRRYRTISFTYDALKKSVEQGSIIFLG